MWRRLSGGTRASGDRIDGPGQVVIGHFIAWKAIYASGLMLRLSKTDQPPLALCENGVRATAGFDRMASAWQTNQRPADSPPPSSRSGLGLPTARSSGWWPWASWYLDVATDRSSSATCRRSDWPKRASR